MSIKYFICIAAITSLASDTWGADKFPDYPVKPAASYAIKMEKEGLTVAVEPVEDLDAQQTYFQTKLAPNGYIPVFLVLQNADTANSYLFDKAQIKYASGNSDLSGPQLRSKTGEGIALASVAALSLAGAIVAMKLITNATHVQQNILKKEIQSKTLSPGAGVHGFLYVPVPKKGTREPIRLRVPIGKGGSDEPLVFELTF